MIVRPSWATQTPASALAGLGALGQCYCPGPCYTPCHSTASWCQGGQVQVGCDPRPAAAPPVVATPVPMSTPAIPPSPSPIAPSALPIVPSSIAPILTSLERAVQPLIYSGGRSFDVAQTAVDTGSGAGVVTPMAGWGWWPWILGGGGLVLVAVVVTRRRRRRRVRA